MAPKSLVLAALLIVLVVAGGLVPRCSGLGSASNSVLVSGIVPCAAGSAINVATAPVFPNAAVQLVCGGKVVAGTTTDGNGAFIFSFLNVSMNLVTPVLGSQCKVVVVTPLAACDKTLASATGTLMAPLKILGIDTGSGSGSGGGLDLGGIIGTIIPIITGLIGGIINMGTQSFSLV